MKTIQKSGEDYLEAIYILAEDNQRVHSVDIAKALGVTKPSTFKALQNLVLQGCVEKESYGTVALTEKGKLIAQSVLKKHKAIRMFLIDILKVSDKEAEIDACKIEHCIGEETTKKLYEFLKI